MFMLLSTFVKYVHSFNTTPSLQSFYTAEERVSLNFETQRFAVSWSWCKYPYQTVPPQICFLHVLQVYYVVCRVYIRKSCTEIEISIACFLAFLPKDASTQPFPLNHSRSFMALIFGSQDLKNPFGAAPWLGCNNCLADRSIWASFCQLLVLEDQYHIQQGFLQETKLFILDNAFCPLENLYSLQSHMSWSSEIFKYSALDHQVTQFSFCRKIQTHNIFHDWMTNTLKEMASY